MQLRTGRMATEQLYAIKRLQRNSSRRRDATFLRPYYAWSVADGPQTRQYARLAFLYIIIGNHIAPTFHQTIKPSTHPPAFVRLDTPRLTK